MPVCIISNVELVLIIGFTYAVLFFQMQTLKEMENE